MNYIMLQLQSTSPVINVSVQAVGDGSSTVLTFPLEDPPFNLALKGNLPVSAVFQNGPSGTSVSLLADRKTIQITFASAPAVGVFAQVGLSLVFAGL